MNGTAQTPEHGASFIATGAGVIFAGTALGFIFRYGFHVLAARALGSGFFGIFLLGLTVFNITEIIVQSGVPMGLVRFVSIYSGKHDASRIKGTILSGANIVCLTSVLGGLSLFCLSRWMALEVFGKPETAGVLRILACLLPFSSLTAIFVHVAQGFKWMTYRIVVTEVIEPLGRIMIAAVLFLLGLKLTGAMAAYAVPTLLGTLAAWLFLRQKFPALGDGTVRPLGNTPELLGFSSQILGVQILGVLLMRVDTLMLGHFRTAEEVGVYGAAQRTAVLGTIVITSFGTVFAPVISQLFSQNQLTLLRHYYQTVAKWIFALSLPLYLGMILYRQPILRLFGAEFVAGSAVLTVLCLGWLVHASTGPTGVMISMMGKPLVNMANGFGVLVVNIALNIFLIPSFGPLGAAIATAISLGLGNIVSLVVLYALFRMHPYRPDFLKPLFAGLLSFSVLFLLRHFAFRSSSWASLILEVLLFGGLYLGLNMVLKLSAEERALLRHLCQKIFPNGVFFSPAE